MAELECCAAVRRQQRKKIAQPWRILLQKRRQLKQQWPQAILQDPGDFQEIRHGIAGVLEPLFVRDPLRGLEHELEIGGNLGGPCFQDRRLGHAIKRVVDLDRAETLAVESEHLLVRQFIGIERTLPFLVGIAAGADVEVHLRSVSWHPAAKGRCPSTTSLR